jgi:hypothetical protein
MKNSPDMQEGVPGPQYGSHTYRNMADTYKKGKDFQYENGRKMRAFN